MLYLKEVFGQISIRDEDGVFLSADEIGTWTLALSQLAQDLRSQNTTQLDLVNAARKRYFERVLARTALLSEDSLRGVAYPPDSRKRQTVSGVYFLMSQGFPNEVKIGGSDNIYGRTKVHYKTLRDTKVIAVLTAPEPFILEGLIHETLDWARCELEHDDPRRHMPIGFSEWFFLSAVEDFKGVL